MNWTPLPLAGGVFHFLLTLYSYRTSGVRKGGGELLRTPMRRASAGSTANQHCRYRVQRLRGEIFANSLPGSQGLDPRTLRPERLKWLRNFAKSEPAAQIAAFPNTWRKPSGSRRTAAGVCLQTPRSVPCGPVWKNHRQPSLTPHAEVLRASEASKHGQVMGGFVLRGPLTGAPQGEGSAFPPAGLSPITKPQLHSRRPQGPRLGRDTPSHLFSFRR